MATYTYEQVRGVVQDGDVIFIEGLWKKPSNALIMFFTNSRFHHVGIACWVGTGNNRRCLLIEAHGRTKRRIILLSYYSDHNMVVIPGPLPWDVVQNTAFERIAHEGYGYLDAVYIGLREACLRYFGIKLPTYDFPMEVCSEFVAKVYQLEDTNISPQALYEQLIIRETERGV